MFKYSWSHKVQAVVHDGGHTAPAGAVRTVGGGDATCLIGVAVQFAETVIGVGTVAGKESRRCEMCVQHRKRKCGPDSKFKGCLRRLRDQHSRCRALPAFYPDTREGLAV